ncbi:hypothetical protein FOL47_003407 [Perkinsus chesapeaki]|uniref:Peptidase C1A papain C-terminal domain-containing protein n=1 Tax=Perkinsus chesapeaki TaxID=330153 RepID=A0A7J6M844_PERCH|nr:hypothetical protein FOL47_003407 [Perkinsus chesapeaki]
MLPASLCLSFFIGVVGQGSLKAIFAKLKATRDTIYNIEEEKLHYARFEADVKQATTIGDLSPEILESLFDESRPALMQFIADRINSKHATWVASQDQPHFYGISHGDMMLLHGSDERTLNNTDKSLINSIIVNGLPLAFDSREDFSACAGLIGHVSDQSNCNSCGAISVAGALGNRLCIKTNGKVRVQLSPAYAVACCVPSRGCTGVHGCLGANYVHIWEFTHSFGIPTGGDYTPVQSMTAASGCWPYNFPKCNHTPPNMRNHSVGKYPPCGSVPARKPPCQSSCPNRKYRTNLLVDLHFTVAPGGIRVTPNVGSIKSQIYAGGPVTAAIVFYDDLLYYNSGVYTHVYGAKVGYHLIKLIGWGMMGAQGYWLAVNSWNEEWGESGLLKIGFGGCEIEQYVMYGDPDVST